VFILGLEVRIPQATKYLRSWVHIGLGDKVRVSVNSYDFMDFLLQIVAFTAYSVSDLCIPDMDFFLLLMVCQCPELILSVRVRLVVDVKSQTFLETSFEVIF